MSKISSQQTKITLWPSYLPAEAVRISINIKIPAHVVQLLKLQIKRIPYCLVYPSSPGCLRRVTDDVIDTLFPPISSLSGVATGL